MVLLLASLFALLLNPGYVPRVKYSSIESSEIQLLKRTMPSSSHVPTEADGTDVKSPISRSEGSSDSAAHALYV